MMYFIMVFTTDFSLTSLIKRDNEHDRLIENVVYPKTFDEDMNRYIADDHQNINPIENLEYDISSSMDSTINEIVNYKNENNYDTNNIANLPRNKYNNLNSEYFEITTDDKEFRRDIEEALANPYVQNFVNQYEQSLISNNANFSLNPNPLMTSSDKMVPEHFDNNDFLPPVDNKETTITSNRFLERQIENLPKTSYNLPSTSSEINRKDGNDIANNSVVTSDNILNNKTKYISNLNSQCNYAVYGLKYTLVSDLILNDSQFTIIPNLILYKECLKSLSMKNNCISFIPESITELNSLRKLDLSHNNINKIHYNMKNMKLESLDLSYNCLEYSCCKSIFAMTTLKYLNLQNNNINFIERFNSKELACLNLSNNPIGWITDYFYELPNIVQLFMSNLKVTQSIYFYNVLPKLKILDLSNNKSNFFIHNIGILGALEEVNLSNCGIKSFPISLKMFNLKKLILSKNKIRFFFINFKSLKYNIEMLDLRENPLEIFSTKHYLGALDIVACYSGKVLLDESIIETIQGLSFDQISSQKYKKKSVYFKKIKKNKVNDEFNHNIISEILETNDEEVRKNVEKVIILVEEIRESGFLSFEKTIEHSMKIIKGDFNRKLRIKRVLTYLNTKFSSKFYRFLEGILFNYKLESLKSALIYIYNSDEHLNYWRYHLRDSLSFTDAEPIQENPEIHKDKNIILWSFISITNSDVFANIVKLELEKDPEMIKLFYIVLGNKRRRFKKVVKDGILKEIETLQDDHIKYILKRYQIIDQSQ